MEEHEVTVIFDHEATVIRSTTQGKVTIDWDAHANVTALTIRDPEAVLVDGALVYGYGEDVF